MNPCHAKDESIQTVLSALAAKIGDDGFDIVDHWEADLCAIGVASPQNHEVLAYISAIGAPGKFYVSLELPPESGSDFPYVDAGARDTVSLDELIDVVSDHIEKTKNG